MLGTCAATFGLVCIVLSLGSRIVPHRWHQARTRDTRSSSSEVITLAPFPAAMNRAEAGEHRPFQWHDDSTPSLLCLKLRGYDWSGAFDITKVWSHEAGGTLRWGTAHSRGTDPRASYSRCRLAPSPSSSAARLGRRALCCCAWRSSKTRPTAACGSSSGARARSTLCAWSAPLRWLVPPRLARGATSDSCHCACGTAFQLPHRQPNRRGHRVPASWCRHRSPSARDARAAQQHLVGPGVVMLAALVRLRQCNALPRYVCTQVCMGRAQRHTRSASPLGRRFCGVRLLVRQPGSVEGREAASGSAKCRRG